MKSPSCQATGPAAGASLLPLCCSGLAMRSWLGIPCWQQEKASGSRTHGFRFTLQ